MPEENGMVVTMKNSKDIIIKATIECPICGQKTSDRAERCSNCNNRI